MKVGLFHGYELSGSGSNEYNRYLARTLVEQGHEVHILCREPNPQQFDFIDQAWIWSHEGLQEQRQLRQGNQCIFHYVPLGSLHPVYLQDKQRKVPVKAFVNLSDRELLEFKQINEQALLLILQEISVQVLMANHLVMQPSVAIKACQASQTPLVIFPHGSAIEYVVKKDRRYWHEAYQALDSCQLMITGNGEVRDRILGLFPDLADSLLSKSAIVGVGVDTRLFIPCAKQDRKQRIADFIAADFAKLGKNPEECQALQHDLQQHRLEKLSQHPKPYAEGLDQDIDKKLQSVKVDQPIVLFVGALTVGKGLQSLILAMALVLEKSPKAQLLIIGAGAYRETLEALIYALQTKDEELLLHLCEQGFDLDRNEETGPWPDVQAVLNQQSLRQQIIHQGAMLAQQIHFLGRLNHQQLSYIFPCADLAVFPSVIPEAYPLVLMESLANGVLPMVSYFSGFRDGIDELYRYLDSDLVDLMKIPMEPNSRIVSMAEQIHHLLGKTQSTDYAAQLSQIAKTHYDWRHRGKALIACFSALIEKPQA